MTLPDRLYRYRPLTAYSLGELVNGTIWFAKPGSFNDPYDCAITVDERRCVESIEALRGEAGLSVDGLSASEQEDEFVKWVMAFQNFRANILRSNEMLGICSFTTLSGSMLMWSHYASNHKGFAMEYRVDEPTAISLGLSEVRYETEMPSLLATDFAAGNLKNAADKLWQTKALCWDYEKEWRLMVSRGNVTHLSPFPMGSIIFGARMPRSDRMLVRNAVRHRDIRFKEAKLRQGTFILDVVDVDFSNDDENGDCP